MFFVECWQGSLAWDVHCSFFHVKMSSSLHTVHLCDMFTKAVFKKLKNLVSVVSFFHEVNLHLLINTLKLEWNPNPPATVAFVWWWNRKLTSTLRVLAVAMFHLTLYFQQCYSPTNTFLVQEYIPLCNPQWTVYKILNRSSRLVPIGWQGVLWKTAKTRRKMKEHKPASWPRTADCSNFQTFELH